MSNEKDFTTISFRLPRNMKAHLLRLCLSMSKQEGRVISISEFVRNTMLQCYPNQIQTEMFVKDKPKRLRRKSS